MRQKGFTPLITLLFLVVVALMGAAYFAGTRGLFGYKLSTSLYSPQPYNSASNATGEPRTYYSDILDISFDYTSDWKITTGSYKGDVALGNSSGDPSGTCKYIYETGYLKDLNSCEDSTIKFHSPGITITSPDGKSYLQFTGPTSGLGGGCDENFCPKNPNVNVPIKNKEYEIKTVAIKSDNALFETLIIPQSLGIPSGSKSIWKKFDIFLVATDKQAFDTELKILESIR